MFAKVSCTLAAVSLMLAAFQSLPENDLREKASSIIMNADERPAGIEHVIVIGVDGLSPDGIRKAETPNIDRMVANGAVKWNVRTVLTSASSQNWASMIMGAGPEQHGIINNDWEMDDHS